MTKDSEDETIQSALDSMSGNVWMVIRSPVATTCRPCPRGWSPDEWAGRAGLELLFSGTEEEALSFLKNVAQVLES